MRLKDQVAVVTGAGSGIGRAIAVRFAAEGARIVVAELNAESGEQTADLLRSAGHDPLVVATDVTDPEAVRRLFAAVDERGWPVDVLVNNAGTAEAGLMPTAEVPDDRWHAQLRVHLDGTFYCIREALRRMVPRQRGAIINLGSVAGLGGLPGAIAYTAAKGGVIALTKGLSQEVAPQGIRVNCIAPGWINTPMLNHLPEKWRPGMLKHTPLGRLGEPEDIAGVALFLASEDSAFVVGQIISPNGGMYR
ncbi:MAG: SDR family oxidoreductase [Pirellulales bacterium]|nr:SDR family oxidoreductase [Pirellulales bacterium]